MEEKIEELCTCMYRFRAGYNVLQEYLDVLERNIEALKRSNERQTNFNTIGKKNPHMKILKR